MTQYGTWVSYGGTARIWLAIVLLASAAVVAYAGTRLPRRYRAGRTTPPRRVLVTSLLVSWALAIVAFLICVAVYIDQEIREHLAQAPPSDPITPVTFIGVGATFVIIVISSGYNGRTRLAGAIIGALAAPMIFELPFDLIVMARTYPSIPPDPAAYRALFFVPLILIEVTTLALLALSPMPRLSRTAFFSFASMLAVFAVWALSGFGYPSAPLPIVLNVLSKILAFVTALSLFLPPRAPGSAPEPVRATLGGPA